MGLSCGCGEWDGEGWAFYQPNDYTTLQAKRRKRCCSCGELIDIGATCLKFLRFRRPNTDIEERIYGEDGEVYLADWFMCERCADLYFSLEALGFCVSIEDDMRALVREYAELYGAAK